MKFINSRKNITNLIIVAAVTLLCVVLIFFVAKREYLNFQRNSESERLKNYLSSYHDNIITINKSRGTTGMEYFEIIIKEKKFKDSFSSELEAMNFQHIKVKIIVKGEDLPIEEWDI